MQLKKSLAVGLCLLMVAPTALAACEEDDKNNEKASVGLEYVLSDDGTYYAVKSKGTCVDTELYIPDTHEGKPVKYIQDNAFYNDETLTALSIGDNVEEIGFSAFGFCENLKEIKLGVKLKEIGYAAFSYVNSVNAYTVASKNAAYKAIDGDLYSKDMKTLIYYAGGKETKKFTIPNGVEKIGEEAFFKCNNLEEVVFSDSVTSVGRGAFSYSDNLKRVSVGKGLKSWEYGGTFIGCDMLEEVTISEENQQMQIIDGVIYSKDGKMIYMYLPCKKDASYTIGEDVTLIGSQAFYFNDYLQSVTLGDNVEEIGDASFAGCKALKEIYIGSGLKTIRSLCFDYCDSLEKFVVPEDNLYMEVIDGGLYKQNHMDGTLQTLVKYSVASIAEELVIPEGVEHIDNRAFTGAKNLKTLTLPQSLNLIGFQAFQDCESLSSVMFKNTENWYIGWSPVVLQGTDIEPTQLQDAATAAELLTKTYSDYDYWICREQMK